MSSKNSPINASKWRYTALSAAMMYLLGVPVYLKDHPEGFGFGIIWDQAIGCVALVGGIYGLLSLIWIAKCAADDLA